MKKLEKKMLVLLLSMGIVLTEPGARGFENYMAMAESDMEEVKQAEFTFDENTGCLTFFGEGAIVGNPEEASNDAGMKYMDIGEWKKSINVHEVKSVVIGEGVTEIYPGAFTYMINAEKVMIAGTVKKIGAGAFGGCDNLTEVIIEDGNDDSMTEIGKCAFADCMNLKKITLGKNVGILGERFLGTAQSLEEIVVAKENPYLQLKDNMLYSADGTQLYVSPRTESEEIIIPEGTKVIHQLAFAGSPVRKVRIAASVEVLKAGAFQNCEKLMKITFEEDSKCLQTEEYYRYFGDEVEERYTVFGNCSRLKKIAFGNQFETLSENTFIGCNSLEQISFGKRFKGFMKQDGITATTTMNQTDLKALKKVKVVKANENFCTEKGVLYTKAKDVLCMYPGGKKATAYHVADSVEVIGENAFGGNQILKEIALGSQTKQIKDYAFCNSANLISVDMKSKLTKIGERAFEGCAKLSKVKWTKKVKYVGDYAFWGCKKLKSIVLNKNANVVVLRGAFQGCKNVTEVVWPKSFKKLGAFAFAGCKKISNAVIAGEDLRILSSTFSGCKSLGKVTLGSGITEIGQYAFYGCASLGKIKIPDTVTVIDGRALGYKRAEKTFNDVKVKNFTIYGKAGSAAQSYAERYKMRFKAI